MIYSGRYDSLDDLQDVVNQVVLKLRPKKHKFDSIVVRGMSGVLVGAPVALRLKKPLVIVRKLGDQHHNPNKIINVENIGDRWLFLDDFIATGSTRAACETALADIGTHIGSFIYNSMEWL